MSLKIFDYQKLASLIFIEFDRILIDKSDLLLIKIARSDEYINRFATSTFDSIKSKIIALDNKNNHIFSTMK